MADSMLDFGCGDGGFDEILPDRLHRGSWLGIYGGKGAYGIDINKKRIEKARITINNGTVFHACDGSQLPFASNSVNFIHCYGALHHMDDYTQGIKEMVRILRSCGSIYMVETVDNDFFYRIARRIWGKWRGDDIKSWFTSYDLEDVLRQDIRITSVEYYHRFVVSDLLYNFKLEPTISLHINQAYSGILKALGIDQACCCHVVIRGMKV